MNDLGGLQVGFYGKFCRAFIACARRFNLWQYQTPPKEQFTEPAVYICRHSDAKGPLCSMLNLPIQVHPWTFYVFCDVKNCFKHYSEYTFPVRFGWSKLRSKIVSFFGVVPYVALIKSAGAIPVYRHAVKIYTTFKLSVEALEKGESVLLFPDINYTASTGDTGALYEGFVILERMYFKKTGKHLPFVPLHISDEKKSLFIDEPILFEDGKPFKEQQLVVVEKLHKVLNEMTEKYGS